MSMVTADERTHVDELVEDLKTASSEASLRPTFGTSYVLVAGVNLDQEEDPVLKAWRDYEEDERNRYRSVN